MGNYLYRLIGVCLLVSLLKMLIPAKGLIGTVYKMICGVLIASVMIAPLSNLRIYSLSSIYDDIRGDAEHLSVEGRELATKSISRSIEDKIESYILDKAADMNLNLDIQLQLSNDGILQPENVIITGTASPYAKKKLIDIISNDLGITEGNIIW